MGMGVGTISGIPMLFWEGNYLHPPPFSKFWPSQVPTVRVSQRQHIGPVICHGSGFSPNAQFLCGPLTPCPTLTAYPIHTWQIHISGTTKRTFGVVNGSVWPCGC